MVLERLIKVDLAEQKPYVLMFFGFLVTSLAMAISLWVFPSQASMIALVFVLLAITPIIYAISKKEVSKDATLDDEVKLLEEHSKAIILMSYIFLGVMISVSVWYVLLPPNLLSIIFGAQILTLSGGKAALTGNAYKVSVLLSIFFNNLRVMLLALLFSFLYGVGFVFLLVWNVSVVGVALGNLIRARLGEYAVSYGPLTVGAYIEVVSLSATRYFIHGIPELIAYVVAGFAGVLISLSVLGNYRLKKKYMTVLFDVSDLILLSVLLLFISALIEVYATPFFY